MARDRAQLAGTLAAVVGAALFGMLGPLSRFAADAGVEGVAFTAWRAALGAAFLLVLIALRGRAASSVAAARSLSRRGRTAFAVAALMGLTLNAAMFTAFGLIPIALTLMLFYTYPAGVVVVDLVLGRERLTSARLGALLLATLGVMLVLFGGSGSGLSADPLGIALGLAAAASQVVFVTVSRHGYDSVPADAATLGILATAMVGAAAISVVAGLGPSLVSPFTSADAWVYLLLAGVAAAGVSSLLFLTAIRLIGGTRTGILMLLEPVVGVLLAALLLGERLDPLQALGGVLVLAGALVLQVGADPNLDPIEEGAASPVV